MNDGLKLVRIVMKVVDSFRLPTFIKEMSTQCGIGECDLLVSLLPEA